MPYRRQPYDQREKDNLRGTNRICERVHREWMQLHRDCTEASSWQIYTWVQKYKKYGEDSLKDRQGRHKKDYKPQTEEERLRLENATLKRQLYLSQMEIDVLKKLQELERGNR